MKIKETLQKVGNFYSECADNYQHNKISRYATRLGLLFSSALTIGSYLNIDNITTKLNQEATLPLAGMTLLFFGIPVLINFLREKRGYYK